MAKIFFIFPVILQVFSAILQVDEIALSRCFCGNTYIFLWYLGLHLLTLQAFREMGNL